MTDDLGLLSSAETVPSARLVNRSHVLAVLFQMRVNPVSVSRIICPSKRELPVGLVPLVQIRAPAGI